MNGSYFSPFVLMPCGSRKINKKEEYLLFFIRDCFAFHFDFFKFVCPVIREYVIFCFGISKASYFECHTQS